MLHVRVVHVKLHSTYILCITLGSTLKNGSGKILREKVRDYSIGFQNGIIERFHSWLFTVLLRVPWVPYVRRKNVGGSVKESRSYLLDQRTHFWKVAMPIFLDEHIQEL